MIDAKHLEKALVCAKANCGKSVIRINEKIYSEAKEKKSGAQLFGIKNTNDLPIEILDRLRNHPDYLWLSVDKMSDLGRSVDIDLINPITYRCMTGSSSGGCINVLKGVVDIAIGTDGGGSVIAPAVATNLFSFMGKGIGLTLKGKSVSTDHLGFVGGIGVIGTGINQVCAAAQILGDFCFSEFSEQIRVVVPARGNMQLPTEEDAYTVMEEILLSFPQQFAVTQHCFENIYDRTTLVKELNELIAQNVADVFLSLEGPIDVYGYDETIPKKFAVSENITGKPSKAFAKAANICNCSTFTVPSNRIATGFVIVCPPGQDKVDMGLALAKMLESKVELPPIFIKYFYQKEKLVQPSKYI